MSKIRRALFVLLLAGGAAPAAAQTLTIPTLPQSARVYARDGSLLAEIGPQVRSLVSLKSLPAYVPRAFVAVEDRRFYEHNGVDAVGIARAVKSNLEGDREGASTITQQLVGTLWPNLVDRKDMTLERKVKEAELAISLEKRYTKERILETYLNAIYFGHGWYGIDAAARHYFGKPAAKLNHEETAMLAALPKGAGVYSPFINQARALERRNLVLDLMAQNGVIGAAEAAAAKRRPLRLASNYGYAARPPWVIEQVRQYLVSAFGEDHGKLGLQVWTTIDPAAQNAADSSLVRGLRAVERLPWYKRPKFGTAAAKAGGSGTNYLQGLVVSLDARSGEVLAMTGGRDWDDSQFNRVLNAQRQPGSSFKPFVYAAALDAGVTPATVVQDTALRIQLAGSPLYEPKNSDDLFRGPVTVRQALTQSINTVAIQLGMQTGLESVVGFARRAGLSGSLPPYPASMIGAGAVKPIELASAYTAFANYGMKVDPLLIRRVADVNGKVLFEARGKGRRVLSPATAFQVTDMLRDAAEKGTGIEARQRLPRTVPMAGKTGTTNDGTDVWYVGYTPEVVTAVWLGFDTPRSIGEGAYGGALAAPIWGDMMKQLYARRRAPAPWRPPAGVLTVAMDPATSTPVAGACPPAPLAREYFRAGTEPAGACLVTDFGVVSADSLRVDSLGVDGLGADTATVDTGTVRR